MSSAPAVILNVDDDEVSRYAKTRTLVSGGFEVVEASSGAEALQMVEDLAPAVVVLDVRLPDMNGLDVCRIIKQKRPGIFVLQISAALTGPFDRIHGLKAGADSYLVQPAEPQELIASVHALLRIRKAESELRKLNETLERRVRERTQDLAEAYEALQKEIKERKRAEARLVQSQKMEAIGQLTGGIAHDFNNLLHVMLGNLDIIKRRLGDSPDEAFLRPLNNATRGAERAATLTNRLLAFSRRQALDPEPINFNNIVNGLSDLLRRTLGETITVETILPDDIWWTRADANQLDSALLNLAINSRDAMTAGGKLTIETANVVLDQRCAAAYEDIDAGEYVMVTVRDTGIGMSKEVLSRVFEPFFTTKEIGQGTGLGLPQVYGFVKQSGGHIKVDSEEGKGTAVSLYFPRLIQAPVAPKTDDASAIVPATRGDETILVVEDEDSVLEYATSLLDELGYRVLVARNGGVALDILDRERGISLLFTDVGLPGRLNGKQLADEAMRRNSELKILFTTGYARGAFKDQGIEAGVNLITKPFSLDALANKIRRILDATE